MSKKLLCFSILFLITICFFNVSYAFNASDLAPISDVVDNTLYSPDENEQDILTGEDFEDAATSTTTDYESETELSISNIINIVLISVGIVLILLGVAIIIKLN